MIEIDSGSAHGEGELGTGIGGRDMFGFWCGDDAENFWRVGDLDPEILTGGSVIALDQELHRIDFCKIRSIYASQDIVSKREIERTFAAGIPSLEPTDGRDRNLGKSGQERCTANISGKDISHGFFAPRVLQASGALNAPVEAPRESHVSFRMAARQVDPTEEAFGDLPGYRVIVGCEGNAGCDATRNNSR